jgi:uncharacterized protein (DUF433 family)
MMINWRCVQNGGNMKAEIICDPDIMMGKPVISGTRITVELILEKLSCGESYDDIIEAHPQLTKGAIAAALKFASEALRADKVFPIKKSA